MNRFSEIRPRNLRALFFLPQLFLVFSILSAAAVEGDQESWWNDRVEEALRKAGNNRGELQSFLRKVPESRRPAAVFLLENMPSRDLSSLKAG
ncbi:MAG: hypothetical protein OSB83_14045, partial [Planctomycetota bacterium]|nr:hypothetical protein [Planctomycetota bacterium]